MPGLFKKLIGKDVEKEVLVLIKKLEDKKQFIPANWWWHKDRIKALLEIEKKLLKELPKLEALKKKDIKNLLEKESKRQILPGSTPHITFLRICDATKQYLGYLDKLLRRLEQVKTPPSLVNQYKEAEKINEVLGKLDSLINREI